MGIKFKFLFSILLILQFLLIRQPLRAQTVFTSDIDMPTVKVAMSDDHSIIIERVLYNGLIRSGYQIISNRTGMRTAVADVNYGDAVILPTQTAGWDRMYPNLIQVPVALDNVEYSAYSRADTNYNFSRWEDLSGLRLGYRWQNEYVANNIRRASAAELIAVNDYPQLWASLLNGSADVVILPRMSHYEHKYPKDVRKAGILERQPVYTYVNNMHSDLVPLLENSYREMFTDGTMDIIYNSRLITNDKPIILFINSHNAQNEWERSQTESIRKYLEPATKTASYNVFEYYNFYLNSNELLSRASYNAIVADMIRAGFISRHPDLIISCGNEALDFVLNNYYLLFPNVPVVFFGAQGVNDSLLYGLEDHITGISQSLSFEETVSFMQKLFPGTSRIFILNDHSLSKSIKLHEEIQMEINSIKQNKEQKIEFVFSENKPFTEILADIRSFGSNTLVLIGNFFVDSEGEFFSEAAVQNLAADASKNPVFILTSRYSGHGAFAGLVTDTDMNSKAIASMSLEILNGKSPSQIPIVFNSSSLNKWHIDYNIAKRNGINTRNFPQGHIVINRALPIWESNPLEFNMMIMSAVIFLLLVFIVMASLRMRIKKQADENMQLLLDALPMCCVLLDEKYNTVDCNKAGVAMYGFKDKQEFLSRFMTECFPDHQPDGVNSAMKSRMNIDTAFDEGYNKFEWVHKHLNGELIPTEVTLIRLKHHKLGFLVAGYTRDLSEHKAQLAEIERNHEDLRYALEAAETANRTKTTFLANMSHEIRTPMNSIIGFAELVQQNNSPEKLMEYISNILQSAKCLLQIINDILDISKIESGKVTLENIPFDLHDILDYCRMTIQPVIKEKKLTLQCDTDLEPNKKLLGDPIRLRQVLINLLSNAVKFTFSGSVKLNITAVNRSEKKVSLHFEIKDTGIGMNIDQIEKVYEPFMQTDNSVTRRLGGTGLGIPITMNIIEIMGGKLIIDSKIGIGSKFSFDLTFDLACGEEDTILLDDMANHSEKPNFTGEILICEDNYMNQQVICDHLGRVGLETVIANNGLEGVETAKTRKIENKPFDLIFMDIQMPVMDGLEAATKIVEMGIKTPIIALTANLMSDDIKLYLKNNIAGYLGKPFTSQELWTCLTEYLPVVSYTAIDKKSFTVKQEDDKDFQKKMRINFVKSNQSTYSQIIKALHDSDLKLARRITHTLKSSAGLIGESKLQAIAAALEGMLEKNINPLDKNEINILETELKSVLSSLNPLLLEIEANKKPLINDAEKILEILDKLEPMLIKKNPNCEELIDDILTIPGAEELAKQTDKFNFKQALIELSKIRKDWEKNDAQ